MIQSCNIFAQAMTAELSWHVQNCDLIGALFFMKEEHVLLQYWDFDLRHL